MSHVKQRSENFTISIAAATLEFRKEIPLDRRHVDEDDDVLFRFAHVAMKHSSLLLLRYQSIPSI